MKVFVCEHENIFIIEINIIYFLFISTIVHYKKQNIANVISLFL